MLTLYTGLYENLTTAQQRAILKLTVRRYVDDIYHLDAHLQQAEGLTPGTPEFERTYATHYEQIQNALAEFDDHTYIAAILLTDQSEEWIALASMRTLLGQRADVTVAQSIGHADSSIPTHTLLQAFQYPHLPDFNPDSVTEAEIFEVSRLAAADHVLAEQLISAGVMSQAELQAVLTSAFDELIVNSYRTGNTATHVAGWIFNVKPKLAAALKLRKGLNLSPLYSQGVEPTEQALNSALDKPYFHRWHAELFKLIPEAIVQQGMLAAVRYMASRDIREWQDCEVSLPYLLVNNAELECAIEKLEAKLAQRTYELIPAMAYA